MPTDSCAPTCRRQRHETGYPSGFWTRSKAVLKRRIRVLSGQEAPKAIQEGLEPVANIQSMLDRSSLNDAVERFDPKTALLNATRSAEQLGIS